jgi:hypothetical protein
MTTETLYRSLCQIKGTGRIFLSPVDHARLRKFGRDRLEIVVDQESLKQGWIAVLLKPSGDTQPIGLSPDVPTGHVIWAPLELSARQLDGLPLTRLPALPRRAGVKEIEPINRDTDQLFRVAARHNLTFHINQFGYLVEHRGYKSEERPATDYELDMWYALVPELRPWKPGDESWDVPVLDATKGELDYALIGPDPFTFNAADVAVMRHMVGFTPCNDRASLQRGLVGHYQGRGPFEPAPIYVSRAIPKGYFYQGTIERWQPPESERVLEPEMDPQLQATIMLELHALIDHSY